MITNPQLMGKRTLASALALGIVACASPEASADDPQNGQAELIQASAVTTAVSDTRTRTMAECRVLAERAEKIACMQEVRAAREAEIAAKTEQRQANAETIADNETANQQRRTTIEGLTRVVALQEGETPSP